MRKQISIIARLCLPTVLLVASSPAASVPDWVRQAANQTLPAYDPETKAVVLLDEGVLTVNAPNEFLYHQRRVVKVLRPEGREEGDLAVPLHKLEELLFIHAWSIDRAGREYELKDKDFSEFSPYTYELYSDIRSLRAKAPSSEQGSIIAFEYEIRQHPWVPRFDWYFQEMTPVRDSHLTVQLPAGWEFKTSWSGMPLSSSLKPETTHGNGQCAISPASNPSP